jgi:hypothetical protein
MFGLPCLVVIIVLLGVCNWFWLGFFVFSFFSVLFIYSRYT